MKRAISVFRFETPGEVLRAAKAARSHIFDVKTGQPLAFFSIPNSRGLRDLVGRFSGLVYGVGSVSGTEELARAWSNDSSKVRGDISSGKAHRLYTKFNTKARNSR